MKLSRHFIEKWKDLISESVSEEDICELKAGSICVQKGQTIYRGRGDYFVVPAIFWNFAKRLMIKVDEKNDVAITVYTADKNRRKRWQDEKKRA